MALNLLTISIATTTYASEPVVQSRRQVSEEALLFKKFAPSVFTVYSDEGKGSAFLVDSQGLIATNAHVIGNSKRIGIKISDSLKVMGVPILVDTANDVAILWINPAFTKDRPVLRLSRATTDEDYAFVGERVLAIGSPLNQETILTTGIISKVGESAVISDVSINPGNSGGPLLNLDGDVIAINTFRDPSLGGTGVSGSISTRLLEPLLVESLGKLSTLPAPSEKLLPVMPKDQYPLNLLREAAEAERWDENPYRASKVAYSKPGGFEVQIVTPPYLYRVEKKREVDLARKANSRNKSDSKTDSSYDPFEDLKTWTQYLGKWSPTVTINVVPKVGQTTGSILGNILGAAVASAAGTWHTEHRKYEFKADLESMDLLRNGSVVAEIQRGITWQPLDFNAWGFGWTTSGSDLARTGVAVYECDHFLPDSSGFAPMELVLLDRKKKKSDQEVRFSLPAPTVERVALDFEEYCWQRTAKSLHLDLALAAIRGKY